MRGRYILIGLLLGSAFSLPVMAQEVSGPSAVSPSVVPPPVAQRDVAVLEGTAGTDGAGRLSINLATGTDNQQANAALIAIGDYGTGVGVISQHRVDGPSSGRGAHAAIEGSAFAGSAGMTAVNIAAGTGNQEANLAVISIGIEGWAASDAMLGQTRASQEPNRGTGALASPEHTADISAGAFQGSSGLVQLNLIGGERNSSSNSFALSVSANANPM